MSALVSETTPSDVFLQVQVVSLPARQCTTPSA